MKKKVENLLNKLKTKQIRDEKPVFCFTSDIDWASEDVIKAYFNSINQLNIKLLCLLPINQIK